VTVRPDECIIGFGIPLSEEAFRRQAENPNGGDFIRSQNLTWPEYRWVFADPCQNILPHLRAWGVGIVEGLTLQTLGGIFSKPPRTIILFAHWSSDGRIELTDGLVSSEQVVSVVPNDFAGIMDLCVCHPRRLVELLKQKCPDCLVKFTDTEATPLWWIYLYTAMFKILLTQPDYFQALADAFESLNQPERLK